MTFIYILIFGIVQGITEFLPVSSSGHLLFVNKIFGYSGDFMFLSILLHVATLLAVLIVFRKDVYEIIRHPFSDLAKKIVVSFIPTFIIVVIFNGFIEDAFSGGSYLSVCFMLTAILLLLCDIFAGKNKVNYNSNITYKSALVMGVMQGIAVMPGISRSGATISGGLFMGQKRENVAKFSFLMSVPVILASLVYDLVFHFDQINVETETILPVILSFILSFLVGIFAIKFMLKVVKKARYFWFSIYLSVIAIVALFI